jgi:hypothetical protein
MTHLEALQRLLGAPDGALVQLIYVNMTNGTKYIFVGAPIDDDDLEDIESVTFGECIPPVLVGMSMAAGAGTTAQ